MENHDRIFCGFRRFLGVVLRGRLGATRNTKAARLVWMPGIQAKRAAWLFVLELVRHCLGRLRQPGCFAQRACLSGGFQCRGNRCLPLMVFHNHFCPLAAPQRDRLDLDFSSSVSAPSRISGSERKNLTGIFRARGDNFSSHMQSDWPGLGNLRGIEETLFG